MIDSEGTEPIVTLRRCPARGTTRSARQVVGGGVNTAVQVAPGGQSMVFVRGDAAAARRGLSLARGRTAKPTPLTRHNAPLLDALDLPEAEGFTFEGADGDQSRAG